MAILSGFIETNGWVLNLTLTGTLSSSFVAGFNNAYVAGGTGTDIYSQWLTNISAYTLSPTTAPALTLTGTATGYIQNGVNVAVSASTTISRILVGSKVLRKTTDVLANGNRRPKNPDEIDNGNGSITVRIALSQHVYATDSATFSLNSLTGWRTGSTAQVISITNNSTIAAPAPIVRWTLVPYQLQSGSFTLECAVASHHPNVLAPVAGVNFTVTDGTTVKNYWVTTLTTSPFYQTQNGDGTGNLKLRVYSVLVDPTTAVALTKGHLRCDFEVYPWIGPVQKSDTAGTKLMTGMSPSSASPAALSSTSASGYGIPLLAPFVVAYNPGNSWVTPRFIEVDQVNGTLVANTVTIGLTAASVSVTTPAAIPAADVRTALEAMALLKVTLTDGRPTPTTFNGGGYFSGDGLTITLRKAGATAGCTGVNTSIGGTGHQYNGIACGATFITIQGDPTDSTQRACILRAAAPGNTSYTYNPGSGFLMWRLTSISMELGNNTVLRSAGWAWIDNVEIRGSVVPSDQTTAGGYPVTGVGMWVTGTKWWQTGSGLIPTNNAYTPLLVRGVQVDRSINSCAIFNAARLPQAGSFTNNIGITNTGGNSTDPNFGLERMAVNNDLRYLNNSAGMLSQGLAFANTPANLQLGRSGIYSVSSRFAWIGNLCETYNGSFGLWYGLGEEYESISTEVIIEGNTFTGDRVNGPYNEPLGTTIALTDSYDNPTQVYRFANNLSAKLSMGKHDQYNDLAGAGGQRIGIALSATRNKAYNLGDEIVIAGTPAYVYHCSLAGTTSNVGGSGPTGTAIGQTDGTAKWDYITTESRVHGYRPTAISGWPTLYGVGFEGNADITGVNNATWPGDKVAPEFFGINSRAPWTDFYFDPSSYPGTVLPTTGVFTLDKAGGNNKEPWQTAWTGPTGATPGGGGSYIPISTANGLAYVLSRAKTANVDLDLYGTIRNVPFAAGALEAFIISLTTPPRRRHFVGSRVGL